LLVIIVDNDIYNINKLVIFL